jgi:drug/metabolite transporter (DMT)-like permease
MVATGMTPTVPILSALAAAALFGASTPFAKLLLSGIQPVVLAGLLYLGSGVGLWVIRLIRDRGLVTLHLRSTEWLYFFGAIVFGGVLAPVLLLWGLKQIPAGDASLLLNLEAVLTALLAWVVFHENADRRIVIGMTLIVAGGATLAWPAKGITYPTAGLGILAVSGACLCWALDNNLTRGVSSADAFFLAGTKGLVAGLTNLCLAFALHAPPPALGATAEALLVGFVGYGISLVLFVLALRGLGSARTGAYFSTGPFFGAAVAIILLHEPTNPVFWLAAGLMAAGVWLHLTERHAHEHVHEHLIHTHRHRHDVHHRHIHLFNWDGKEPHSHEHEHVPMAHSHAHYPDVHHRHRHK